MSLLILVKWEKKCQQQFVGDASSLWPPPYLYIVGLRKHKRAFVSCMLKHPLSSILNIIRVMYPPTGSRPLNICDRPSHLAKKTAADKLLWWHFLEALFTGQACYHIVGVPNPHPQALMYVFNLFSLQRRTPMKIEDCQKQIEILFFLFGVTSCWSWIWFAARFTPVLQIDM